MFSILWFGGLLTCLTLLSNYFEVPHRKTELFFDTVKPFSEQEWTSYFSNATVPHVRERLPTIIRSTVPLDVPKEWSKHRRPNQFQEQQEQRTYIVDTSVFFGTLKMFAKNQFSTCCKRTTKLVGIQNMAGNNVYPFTQSAIHPAPHTPTPKPTALQPQAFLIPTSSFPCSTPEEELQSSK